MVTCRHYPSGTELHKCNIIISRASLRSNEAFQIYSIGRFTVDSLCHFNARASVSAIILYVSYFIRHVLLKDICRVLQKCSCKNQCRPSRKLRTTQANCIKVVSISRRTRHPPHNSVLKTQLVQPHNNLPFISTTLCLLWRLHRVVPSTLLER